jgi:ABC-type transporter MlaC component
VLDTGAKAQASPEKAQATPEKAVGDEIRKLEEALKTDKVDPRGNQNTKHTYMRQITHTCI